MQADSRRKNPTVAGALALVGGPLGFLYVGWRYAVAATVLFLSSILVFTFLVVPPWFKYVNLPVFSFMAYRICEKLNGFVDEGQHRSVLLSGTLPVAVFAMTSMLPLLAAFDSAVFGVAIAVPQLVRGDVGGGLLMLLVVTPLLAALSFVFSAVLATGIDRVVLTKVPGAPRYIFPPVIAAEKQT
jgi:hypothetical protein